MVDETDARATNAAARTATRPAAARIGRQRRLLVDQRVVLGRLELDVQIAQEIDVVLVEAFGDVFLVEVAKLRRLLRGLRVLDSVGWLLLLLGSLGVAVLGDHGLLVVQVPQQFEFTRSVAAHDELHVSTGHEPLVQVEHAFDAIGILP